jgi:hypothetical protein
VEIRSDDDAAIEVARRRFDGAELSQGSGPLEIEERFED